MKVKQSEGRVWIDDLEGFGTDMYASSPHGCQARIMQTLGEKLNYDDMICYSAFAFRVGINEQLCPSAGHPFCGFECMAGSFRALPWKVRLFEHNPWDKPKDDRSAAEAEVCAAIKGSIDRGIPVHYGSEEDGLIIGYGDDGRRWWCVHPYHKNGSEAFWHEEVKGMAGGSWPWGIVVWKEPKPAGERISDIDLTIAALKQAVEMWNTEKVEAYFTGEAAYGHWIEWLRGVESGKIVDARGGMQGNGWCFDVLIHCRRIAGSWLKSKAKIFKGGGVDEIRTAADHYAQIAEICMEDLDTSWNLALSPNRYEEWTGELRREQIARLEASRTHDQAAIAAIVKALDSNAAK